MAASMATFREGFLEEVANSVTNTSELAILDRAYSNIAGEFFLPTDVRRGTVRNFPDALIRQPACDLGILKPSIPDISEPNYVAEVPCSRSLLLETVLLRLARYVYWRFLLQTIPSDGAMMFRRISARDSERIAMIMNQTLAAMVVGVTYSDIPSSVGWQGKRAY